jgi:flagellar biosynthesis protein FlhG
MITLNQGLTKKGQLWVIGGGKGGSGKTFVTSNIGAYLASKGEKVILVDADFCGANLHSFIGVHRPEHCLSNFFENGTPLENIITKTQLDNMGLLVGDIQSLSPDNIKIEQRIKFYRDISRLEAKYILVDIGAGSHRDTIDTFLIADKMITVCEPDVISIENLYQFVKNALYRKLKWTLRPHMTPEVLKHFKGKDEPPMRNVRELIDYLQESAELRDIIRRELEHFKIHLIINKAQNAQDIQLGSTVKSFLLKYLGIKVKYVGFIEYDDSVWQSARKRQIMLLAHPASLCAKEIRTSAENLALESELQFV